MKPYVPILGILLFIGAIVVLRQVTMRQSVTPAGLNGVNATATPQAGDVSEYGITPTPAGANVVQAAGITLTVTSPTNNSTVSTSSIAVRGRTVPDAEVFINDEEVTADGGGNFSATITLDEGENYILVAANDSQGNFAERELTVTYAP